MGFFMSWSLNFFLLGSFFLMSNLLPTNINQLSAEHNHSYNEDYYEHSAWGGNGGWWGGGNRDWSGEFDAPKYQGRPVNHYYPAYYNCYHHPYNNYYYFDDNYYTPYHSYYYDESVPGAGLYINLR